MDIIKASIERPTAVVAAIFMTIVLGFIALDQFMSNKKLVSQKNYLIILELPQNL